MSSSTENIVKWPQWPAIPFVDWTGRCEHKAVQTAINSTLRRTVLYSLDDLLLSVHLVERNAAVPFLLIG